MKKWSILIIVALAAVLLAMQYLMEKKRAAVPAAGPQAGPAEQLGVALPAGATSYQLPAAVDNYVPEAGGGAAYGSAIYLPFIQSSYKGACEGGALNDMLATHDKAWGFFAAGTTFSTDETSRMYAMLSDYVSCNAAARTDVSLCDSLPGAAEKDGRKINAEITPNFTCRKKLSSLFFEAYLAGNIQGDSYCRLGLTDWDKEDLAKVSVPELCGALAAGPAGAAPFLLKAFAPAPPEAPARIAVQFPQNSGDCRKDQECLAKYALYSALKNGRAQDCPKAYQAQCRALLERSTIPCEKLLQDMSKFYCGAVARVKKATGGFVGLTPDQIKAEIEKAKAAKAQEDVTRKEMQKLDEEVNKRAREMLNKK